MKLLGNRVVIVPVIQDQTHGGIVLARMSKQMPDRGVVKHISKNASKVTGVKAGDMVIFDKHHQQLAEDEKTTMIEDGILHLLAIVK